MAIRFVLMASMALQTTVWAQQEDQEAELNPQLQQRVNQMVEKEQTNRRRYADALISKMTLVCDLKPVQVKKLQLAAKGSTEKSLASYRKYMTQIYGGRQKVLANGALVAPAVRPVFGLAAVAAEPIWKKAVKTTLTEEQHKKWGEEEVKLDKFRHQVALNSAISMMDIQIMFTDRQRKEIYAWMEKNIPTKFPSAGDNAPAVTNASRYVLPRLLDYPKNEIKALLAPSQLSLWNDYLARYQRMRAQLKQGGVAAPLPALRAVPAAPIRGGGRGRK